MNNEATDALLSDDEDDISEHGNLLIARNIDPHDRSSCKENQQCVEAVGGVGSSSDPIHSSDGENAIKPLTNVTLLSDSKLVFTSESENGEFSTDMAPEGEDGVPTAKKTPCFVYMLTFLSAIGGFLFGYDTGVVAGALLLLKETFSLNSVWQESIVSVTMGFAALFSIIGGLLNDRFGRKPTILLSSLVFTAGAIILGAAAYRWMLILGRSILGVGIGFASSTVSMYIAECSPSHMRGQLVTLNNAFITGGQFVASIVAGVFSTDQANGWRFMLGLAAIPALFQFVAFLFMPESPRWLIMKGRREEAQRLLVHIRGQRNVDQELEEIYNSLHETDSEHGIIRMLMTPHVRRALIVGCMLQIFQQIIGINTVMYYSATIIRMSGIGSTSSTAIWLASITAAVNFLFTFVGFFLVERIGRRSLTLGSLTGTMFSLIFLAVGFQLAAYQSPNADYVEGLNASSSCSNYTNCNDCISDDFCGYCYVSSEILAKNGSCLAVPRNSFGDPVTSHSDSGRCSSKTTGQLHWAYDYCPTSYSWMATVGLVLYLIFFAPGMGPMPWTVNAEIYPLWARSKGNSISTCCNWLANLVISMTFLTLTESITKYGAFYLYSGFSALAILFVALCLPETKGKQLEEVEELFEQPLVSCRRSNQYQRV